MTSISDWEVPGLRWRPKGLLLMLKIRASFQGNILHNRAEPSCKFYNISTKTIDHLISGCLYSPQMSVKTDNIDSGKPETFMILKHPKNGMSINHYLLWIPQSWPFCGTSLTRTVRTIQANRPDIAIKDDQNKTCQLIDMGVPSHRNIYAKEFGKLSKYRDLETEIARMWKMKTKPYQFL